MVKDLEKFLTTTKTMTMTIAVQARMVYMERAGLAIELRTCRRAEIKAQTVEWKMCTQEQIQVE